MGVEVPDTFVSYALGPLMHVSGHWSAWGAMLSGGRAVLHPDRKMEAATVLDVVEQEHVTMLTIVGDSMGRPIVDAIEAEPGHYDTTSVLMLGSGGSIMSADVKARLLDGFPSVMVLMEAIGSSESPAQALSITARGQGVGPALRFAAEERTTVFDESFVRWSQARARWAGWPPKDGYLWAISTTPRNRRTHSSRSTVSGGHSPETWRPSKPTARSGSSGEARCASTRG